MPDELDARIRSLEAERLRSTPVHRLSTSSKQPNPASDPQSQQHTLGESDTYSAAVKQLAELRRRAIETETPGPRASEPTRKDR